MKKKIKKTMVVVLSIICLTNVATAAALLKPTRSVITTDLRTTVLTEFSELTEHMNLTKTSADEDWKMCYESDKIYIYERWIERGGTSMRERKGVMIAKCDFAKALQLITDYKNQKNWMKNVEENKLVFRKSDTSWITHTLFSLPWPFDNRDVVAEYHVKVIKPGSDVLVKINSLNNVVKVPDGVSRINNYKANWVIQKTKNGFVFISFSASSEPEQIAPAFIIDPILRKTFQKNLLNLRNMLE